MNSQIQEILDILFERERIDFSGYRISMIERRISKRLSQTGNTDLGSYLKFLKNHPRESKHLVETLTIHVSRFFRESLTFEMIAKLLLPAILERKMENDDRTLRIWSAGCAKGEEPYSIAILLRELLEKEAAAFDLNIFATDINERILRKAGQGVYSGDSLRNIKHYQLKKYFTAENDTYRINPEIREMVDFSVYDLLDRKTYIPPVSIFGHFDLVLCRNVLIYFQSGHQEIIFDKIHRALADSGNLVLGETETMIEKYKPFYQQKYETCKIYRKQP